MNRRFIVASLTLLAAVAVIALAIVELQSRGTEGITGFTVADRQAAAEVENTPAPTFSIESLDGGTVSLDSLSGHIGVINFWATWCAPCQQEAPGFRRVSRQYEDRGVQFLGMNERDNRAAAQTFMRNFGLDYPSGFDPSGSLADDFRLYAMPTTFIIDPAGIIRYRFVGYLTETDLRAAIDALLAEGQ